MGAKSHVLYCGSGNPAPLVTVHLSGRSPDTKKAKVASCPGTRQKPSLDARFELFWAPEAPGALFYQIQAQILRPRGRNACDFLPIRLKRPKVVSVSS